MGSDSENSGAMAEVVERVGVETEVITPEGEQTLVDRVFDAVVAKLDAQMGEAMEAAKTEAIEQMATKVGQALMEGADANVKIREEFRLRSEEEAKKVSDEACRRMAYATEQVKTAVKDAAGLDKRVAELRDELTEIVEKAGSQIEDRIKAAVANVASTAGKYKMHIDAAGNFLTAVKNEQDRIADYVNGMLQRGISPEALDGALKDLREKMKLNLETISRIQESNQRRMDQRRRYDGGNGRRDQAR